MPSNRLATETSPYLLQHQNNSVQWRPWSSAVFEDARRENKPILLSVGYAACHWCHVMAHESFENDEIAAVMNELFINVKVDREERPDVDAIYQSALAMLGEQGGWPLTMFLTPDGHPFWGGTYFPPEPRYGRPGFPQVLNQVAHVFQEQPETVQKNVAALSEALAKMAQPAAGQGVTEQLLDEAASAALRMIDPLRGGTAGAPKFPQPTFFRFLWRAHKRTRSPLFRSAVLVTLDFMSEAGIYDHLGGGYARYATDTLWLVPHFEKMLYDNALLVDLMTEVWLDTRSPLYAQRVRETVEWVLSDLRVDPEAGDAFALASAFDADSEGVEGKFYVWSEAEIDRILEDKAERFKDVYDVTPSGNWEGQTILNRTHAAACGFADDEELAACRRLLLRERRTRTPPLRDDKVLADWNGLMITALARAASAFGVPAWLQAAESIFGFITTHMTGTDGRLLHAWCAGQARHPAVADDYANLAMAGIALYEATGRAMYLEQAERWVEILDRHYWDDKNLGYFQSADDTTDLITRSKIVADNAVPSGNGTMTEVLARLFYLTGHDPYRQRAQELVRQFSGDKLQYLMSVPGLLTGAELLERAVQIVITGAADAPETIALKQAAHDADVPLKIINPVTDDRTLDPSHPAFGKESADNQTAAFICVGATCDLPLTEPSALRERLAQA